MRHPRALAMTLLLAAACSDAITPTSPAPGDLALSHGRGHGDLSDVGLELVAAGFTQPVGIVNSGDDSDRLFVIDQVGRVMIIREDGTVAPTPFLDVSAKIVPLNRFYDERGLLGLAFHPKFEENGKFYVYYSRPYAAGEPRPAPGYNHVARIAEYRVMLGNPDLADPTSERVVLEVDKPQSNHNGGTIAFGPKDGYLYISIGDGGGANDVGLGHVEDWYAVNRGGNGQDVEANLLGNILRIDVDGARPYAIPRDNPLVGKPGRDELFAWGFRNPWRFSFDSKGDHDLIVGDAGQNRWEEVSVAVNGGNYGWNVKEGRHCFSTATPNADLPSCPNAVPANNGTATPAGPLIDPVIEYRNLKQGAVNGGIGLVVVGGNVYRGSDVKPLKGLYVFGDWSDSFGGPPTGELFAATPGGPDWPFRKIVLATSPDGELHERVLGFGEDRHRELYLTTTSLSGPAGTTGKVFRFIDVTRHHDDDGDQ
ncbi:MAG TPA: PQQ-dependent sugar dehydrogenase [Gemmatimonadaceae bacterium]|nr:PQQ-dependent sugar dehydrogenase [Gemmatimonadaceae bacterium]